MKKKEYAEMALVYAAVAGLFLAAAWAGSNTVTVMAQRSPVERDHTIVIDAGHGGEDGGAVSCTGVTEKELNLDIALRLDDLLHLMGYRTRMTRRTDISVYTSGETIARRKASDLQERVQMVQQVQDPILISIHQNLFSDPQYGGAQVFYDPAGEGQPLAQVLQMSFRETLNRGSRRDIKKADGIYLMEHIDCPGILVECGFLSNPREEALLRSDEYQRSLCIVIAAGVANFLDCQT